MGRGVGWDLPELATESTHFTTSTGYVDDRQRRTNSADGSFTSFDGVWMNHGYTVIAAKVFHIGSENSAQPVHLHGDEHHVPHHAERLICAESQMPEVSHGST